MKQFLMILISAALPLYVSADVDFPIDSNLNGVETPYSALVRKLVTHWKSHSPNAEPSDFPIHIDCYRDPKNDFALGLRQQEWIRASFERVEKTVDDLPGYSKIVSDLEKVEIIERNKNKLLTRWEQHVPFPFVPNDISETYYLTQKSGDGKMKTYRYQLKRGDNLKYNDGLIVIEAKAPNLTLYTEYDFWDANWGIAKAAGEDKIWQNNVSGTIQSDLAIKLRAENPEWEASKVLEKSNELTHGLPIKAWIQDRPQLPNALPDLAQ